VLGLIAALHLGLPIISVSRGWTAHTWKVRFNERLDRVVLRFMDRVACVSEAQAAKVRHAGVRAERVRVIHNSIDTRRFAVVGRGHEALQSLFPTAREQIVIGVGRLSPEKGFDQLIEAAALVVPHYPDVGFVLVGDGPERERLARLISNANLQDRFILSGFRSDVDALIPGANILAQSSHTEGLPNVVLEACAAGIPVVATDVGGTREVIRDGYNGFLVPAGKPEALAARLLDLLRSPDRRRSMGMSGRQVVADEFSFERQSAEYMALFDEVTTACRSRVTRAIPQTTTGGSVA
jgi:glycosyltransferase involved in cell wall biosynthesis